MSDVEQTVEVTPVVEETTPAVVEEVVAAEVAADEVEEGEAAAEGEGESAGKSQKATPPPSNKLFVGGIVEGVTEADIREFFARVPGEIQEISIHGRYGFVTFATEEDAKAATSLNGEQINGHVMQVEAKKRNNRRENNKRGRESNNNNNNANKGRGRDNQQSGAVTGDRVCFKCNKPGHVAARCRESERLCFHCQRPGHLARECPSAPGRQPFGDRFRDDSRGRRRDRSRSRRRDDSRDRRRYDSRDRRRDRSRSRRRDDSRDRRDDSRDDKKRRRL